MIECDRSINKNQSCSITRHADFLIQFSSLYLHTSVISTILNLNYPVYYQNYNALRARLCVCVCFYVNEMTTIKGHVR